MLKKQWLEGIRGRRDRGMNRGPRDHVVQTGWYTGGTAFLTATSATYCAVVSLNLTPGEPREGRGKMHEHYVYEFVIVNNDNRKYKSCGIHVELKCRHLQALVCCYRQFHTYLSLHAVDTVSLGCIFPNRPIQSLKHRCHNLKQSRQSADDNVYL